MKKNLIIGTQLRRARKFLFLSAYDVASDSRLAAVSSRRILRWEKEEEAPTLRQLEILADIYGREIDFFLKDTDELPKKYNICKKEDIDERGR